MGRAGIEQYLYLLDEAFGGDDWHSLLRNLAALSVDDWLWLPPNGARPIAEMVAHVGACKHVYENHAFGDASLRWDDPLVDQKRLRQASATAETRWIVKSTIEHDLYHAGEINRMRALRQGNDRWAFEAG